MARPPDRSSGRVFASWWNDIHDWIDELFGLGAIGEFEHAIADSQTNEDISGLLFDGDEVRRAVVEIDINRDPGASEKIAYAVLNLQCRNGDWERAGLTIEGDDDHGMDFDVTTAGQVQYTSDSAGAGTMKIRARTFNA